MIYSNIVRLYVYSTYLGQDGDHRETDADEEVEGGKELVKFALAGVVPGVVDDDQDKCCYGSGEPRIGQGDGYFMIMIMTMAVILTHMKPVQVRRAASQPLLSFSWCNTVKTEFLDSLG